MSYLKDQRRKQYNKGVARVDRLLAIRRANRPIPRYLIDDSDPEITEAKEQGYGRADLLMEDWGSGD